MKQILTVEIVSLHSWSEIQCYITPNKPTKLFVFVLYKSVTRTPDSGCITWQNWLYPLAVSSPPMNFENDRSLLCRHINSMLGRTPVWCVFLPWMKISAPSGASYFLHVKIYYNKLFCPHLISKPHFEHNNCKEFYFFLLVS